VWPLSNYYAAQYADAIGKPELAADCRKSSAELQADYVFPFQWEAIAPLRHAIDLNPKDARAPYYLGNLLFDWQPEEAVRMWEKSAAIDPSFAIVHRNLALAYSHRKPPETDRAIAELEKAVSADQKYALHFTELDELYSAAGTDPGKRLALFEKNHATVKKRDDALSREVGLKVFAGKYDDAIKLMTGRKFSVWEGGTLEVADHWVNAHLLRGRKELAAGKYSSGLRDFEAAQSAPENLPNARNSGATRLAEIAYWIGMSHDGIGEKEKAKKSWQEAVDAMYPEPRRDRDGGISPRLVQDYYRALAKQRLGQTADAEREFRRIATVAQQALSAADAASDAPPAQASITTARSTPRSRASLAHYIAGLGHYGLGERDAAKTEFELALQKTPDALGAHAELVLTQSPGSN
jgi:tetratricopeptide (TPR) repeat protein